MLNRVLEGHRCPTSHRQVIRLSALNAFAASMRRNPHFSLSSFLAKRVRVACTAPLIPALRTTQSCALSHASFALTPTNFKTHFVSSWRQISFISIGLTPGHLSRVIRRLAIRARVVAQGGSRSSSSRQVTHPRDTGTGWRC